MRKLSILPSASFFIKVSLDRNAEFDGTLNAGLPGDEDLTGTGGVASGNLATETTLLEDPEAGDTSVEYLVRVDGDTFDGLPDIYL